MALLDIIIPTYNNKEELYNTLFSINRNPNVNVIIVDDGSTDQDYSEFEKFFSQFFSLQIYTMKRNGGPAIARQFGLEGATAKYVMFLDCGDLIFSPFMINSMIETITKDEDLYMVAYQEFEETEDGFNTIDAQHKRLHAKIFSRKFLTRCGIHFSNAYPYANEDVSFVEAALMILEDLQDKGKTHCLFVDVPAVIWTFNPNSLVHKDDNVFNFKHQNKGLAYNSLEAEAVARANKVNKKILYTVMADHLCYMYVSYLNTVTMRPEYTADSFAGASHYYNTNYEYFQKMDSSYITDAYKHTMAVAYKSKEPMTLTPQTLTFYNFLEMLEKNHI